ncbi:MAG: restriction endonuclease subunit S [Shewanella sp.]
MNTKLYDIAEIRPGHPFRGSIEHINDGEAHVVQVRDTAPTGEVSSDAMIRTDLSGKKNPDWLQPGDVLFVAKGARHFAALVENLPKQSVCSPHFFLIRVKDEFRKKVTPEFICWQLNQLPAQRYFQVTAEGSLYLSIRRQVLEYTPITLLPLDRQHQLTAMHRCAVKEKNVLQQLINNRQHQLDAIAQNVLKVC